MTKDRTISDDEDETGVGEGQGGGGGAGGAKSALNDEIKKGKKLKAVKDQEKVEGPPTGKCSCRAAAARDHGRRQTAQEGGEQGRTTAASRMRCSRAAA